MRKVKVVKMNRKFDLSNVEFSRNDMKLGIKVPEYLTEDLAYFLGFHVGDGYMGIVRRANKIDYRLQYDGHQENERLWYTHHIKLLIKKLFNKNVEAAETSRGTVRIVFCSKAILTFLHNCCDIPFSPKKDISVPSIVQRSEKKIKASFLRGLADTDFSLCFKDKCRNPNITYGTYSKTLHESVKILLTELGFTYYSATYYRERKGSKLITYSIDINGKKKLKQWMEVVGFSSYNAITRYLVWKETGHLPVGTNINDRIEILEKRGINPLKAPQVGLEPTTARSPS